MMTSMNVSLPEELKSFVEEQVKSRGYSTVSEYLRELIRQDHERRLREEIDRKLLSALESGDPIPVTPEFWEQRRKELERRVKTRKDAK
jgi:antitoxin ParD1/3/4